jgi:L-aminopeptidase/D-esterase-like protein
VPGGAVATPAHGGQAQRRVDGDDRGRGRDQQELLVRVAQQLRFLPWNRLDDVFAAVVYAVEEAVLNALVAADTMIGRDGHRSPGLPVADMLDLITTAGRPRSA